ncbi:MAG: hypothetical protein ACAI43_03550 [Phycisphaerae bacterium]|nr:hypothetical protein [Tepidisphaeraceae bacterium]
MTPSTLLKSAAIAALTLLPSCGPKNPPASADGAPADGATTKPAFTLPQFFPADATAQADAIKEQQYLVQLIAYRITVPAGAVSRSDDFWKRVNEQAVDPAAYELLFKNNVRVGVAGVDELEYFKNLIEKHPVVTQPSSWTGREARNLDLEIALKVDSQQIFWFPPNEPMTGRTFERCDNLLRIAFQPAPRKHGHVRMALCPVVKSLREVMVAVGEVNQRTVQRFRPEQLYDLNLAVDVPLDSFLVVAPTPATPGVDSLLGDVFLRADGPAERTETLLLFRPIIFRQKFDPATGTGTITPEQGAAPTPKTPELPTPALPPLQLPSLTEPAPKPAAPAPNDPTAPESPFRN